MANRIDSIEVENFKSYRGKQLIGPFKRNFTAVIGPNGAGKSNLMDAISFVLGVTTSDLRGKQLKDLVFRFEHEPPPKTQCYVKLNFVDKENQKIIFKRSINVDNSSCTYFLGEKQVSWAVYQKKLHEINIFPRLKNFLVFQGDVANVAQKSPKEITAIIEAVSGSADLKDEYEQLQLKEKTARESTMFQYQKKRGITAERRQFKEQTKEAEKFNQLTTKIDGLTVKQNLLQLYYIDKEIKEFEAKRKEKTAMLKEIEKDQIELIDKLAVFKQEQAKIHQASLKQQKKIRENEKLVEKKNPSVIKNREEAAFLERRIRDAEAEVKRFAQMVTEQQKKIKQLEADLKEIDLQEASFDKAMKEKETTAVTLSPEQVKKYSSLKEEVGKQVAKELNEVQQLDRQHKLDTSTLEGLKNQKQDLTRRQDETAKEIDQLKSRIEKIQVTIAEVVQNKTVVQSELDGIVNTNNQAKRKQQEISDKLKEIHTALHEAKHDIEQSEHQKKYEQAVDTLKRLYPGVFGRILDLSTPKNSKYHLAITVALGKHMDSIVVEDEKVGFQCIDYLKEQRVGTATFIPLDAIKTQPLEERLRSLGKRVHPIVDVIQFDPHFHKAFEFVCGSTLVVDSLEEARKLAFGGERHKVVTVDGSLISKSGMMTGGTGVSGKLQQKAKRWDLKEVSKLKKDRDEYLKQLTELGHQLRSFAKEQQLTQELSQLETRLKSVKYELELAQDKLAKNQTEKANVAKRLTQIQSEKKKLKNVVEKRSQKMEELRTTINKVEDDVFAKFSKDVGIENVREYESARINRSREESEFKIKLSSQRSRIQNLLEYETGRDLDKSSREQQDKLDDERKKLKAVQDTISKSKAALDKEREEHENLIKAYEKDRFLILDKERASKELKRQLEEIRKRAVAHFHQSSALENQQEQLRNKRHAVYRSCARGDIDLPILSGVEELPGPVDPDKLSAKLLKEDAVQLDFSSIGKRNQTLTKAAFDEKVHRLTDKINGLGFEREAIAPNHKATEKLGDVEKKLEQTNSEFEEAKKLARVAVDEFKAIKEKRCRMFMAAFDHISKQIDVVYKELTSGAGAAYLTLDNLEEPYLHGTSFNPMPPNKPFGDIANLSGGEKSVAALALLFAVASFKPAPFFVLDEVDAALDPGNVNRVANYMKKHADQNHMQFITISLKDKCFDKAGALVGVYVDAESDGSKTLTLDLANYPIQAQ